MNRRKFVEKTTQATAGIGLFTILPSGMLSGMAPSDQVNLGLIGCRSMGFGILKHALKNEGVNCVALCDVDSQLLEERAREVETTFQQKPSTYADFRQLLAREDIDAVIIGTPDHWHCLMVTHALEAGKDVYVEKPMANSIGECNTVVAASRRYHKRTIQVGQQQRSGQPFLKAKELISSGQMGKLRKVNVWANFNYGLGPKPAADGPVPQGVDYNMWLGPAPLRPFNPNRFHSSWRHFWDYGGGLMSDFGVHLLDIALWVKDVKKAPEKVLTFAANSSTEARHRETFDTMNVTFIHEDFVINWDLTAGVQRGPYDMLFGLAFVCENATLVANRSKLLVLPEWDGDAKKFKAEELELKAESGESHADHVANFLHCIRTGDDVACPPQAGRLAALHAHIPNIAARTGDALLLWDDVKNRFTNSKAANQLITPEYRKPWTLPKYL